MSSIDLKNDEYHDLPSFPMCYENIHIADIEIETGFKKIQEETNKQPNLLFKIYYREDSLFRSIQKSKSKLLFYLNKTNVHTFKFREKTNAQCGSDANQSINLLEKRTHIE